MYLRILTALICFLNAFHSYAQQNKVDSIDKVLQGKLTTAERAIAMKDLARAYEISDPPKSIVLYNEALAFAAEHKLNYESAVIYQNKSFVYTAMGEYDQAINVLDSALVLANKSDHANKQQLIAKTYNILAAGYRAVSNYKKTVDYQLKAIAGFESLADYPSLVNAYYNLSLYYKDMNDYQKQLESSNKALEFATKSGKKGDLFLSHVAVAQSYVFLEDMKKASIARDNALKSYDADYSPAKLIGYHLISGLIHLNLSELQKAQEDFSSSLKIAEKNKQLPNIVQSKMQLSRVLAMQKKYKEAIFFA